ncbi:D-ribitol-5-phosphate cytidylyltransferase-like [Polypterus senegalus]|uniref:D-ribitol-5-phosphate cytidylyltransferase-like n=1 Tax=Polypterus senegalus TaxID=55291 RepID=UPI001965B476|nr:D-ribitol-5-phosphate cytidylyltransferase-like [Polypterus senegalus]
MYLAGMVSAAIPGVLARTVDSQSGFHLPVFCMHCIFEVLHFTGGRSYIRRIWKRKLCIQHVSSQESYNIIIIGNTELQEKQEVIDVIANSSMTLLYPVVLILVHISLPESTPFSKKLDEPSAIRRLAKEAKHRNILVYGLLVNYTKDSEELNESLENMCFISKALIKDRNSALTGQLLVV